MFMSPNGFVMSGALALAAITQPHAQTMQKVEISGSKDQYDARRDDTAAKIVVTQEEIVKSGDTTLADVLKRQPGITINGARAGRGGEIRMRGLGAGYTQVLLNGQAMPAGFTLDSVSPGQVERIDIMRAATAEVSTQAIAGTINIVLKAKVATGQRELKLGAEGNGDFLSGNANFQLSDKLGRLGYQLAGSVRAADYDEVAVQTDEKFDSQGRPVSLRQGRPHSTGNYRNLSLTPRLQWTLANGDTLINQTFINLQRLRGNRITDWSTPTPYKAERTHLDDVTDLVRTDLNWVHQYAGGGKLDTRAVLNAFRRQNDVSEHGFDAKLRETLDRFSASATREHGASLIGKFSTRIAEGHALAAGWDAGSSWRDEKRSQHDRPIEGFLPLNTDQAYCARVKRLALYGQDEWAVTPSWSVYLGLRWEGLDTESEGGTFSTIHHRSSVLSPLFQTLWKFPNRNNDQLRFALTRTYKAPSLERLIPSRISLINNSEVSPDTQGNPAVKPELATGIDAAYEHFMAQGAMVSVSAYLRRISDYTRNDISLIGDRWVSMPVNDGRAQTRGIALEGKLPLRLIDKQAPEIELRANFSRNWSAVDNVPGPDNRLGNQTPLSANVGLDYKMSPTLNMGGNFTYKTGGLVRVSEHSSTYSTIKRELDLFGLLKLDAKTQVRVSVANLLKQPHSDVKLYGDSSGRSVSTLEIPFNVMWRVALEMKL